MTVPDPYPEHPSEPDCEIAPVVDLPAPTAVPDHCESCAIGNAAFVAYWDESPTGGPTAFVVGTHCARRPRKAGAELWPIASSEGLALLSLYHWKRWAA